VALWLVLFEKTTSSYDKSDIFLRDHSPYVGIGVLKGALAGDDLAVVDTQGTIHKVCIDVSIDLRIARGNARSRDQVHTGVLVRQDVYVPILLFKFLS